MKLSIDDLDQIFGWAVMSQLHGQPVQPERGDLIGRLRRLREHLEHPQQATLNA